MMIQYSVVLTLVKWFSKSFSPLMTSFAKLIHPFLPFANRQQCLQHKCLPNKGAIYITLPLQLLEAGHGV
jgi:hypothetical protein